MMTTLFLRNRKEPPHDKTNKMTRAPSEDRSAWASAQSDQSLDLAVRVKKPWVLGYP